MAGISSKALKPGYAENNYKFNGIEQNNALEMNIFDAKYRSLDPQIARFWQTDPKPVDSISPYAMMYNNPIRYNDPLGDTIVVNLFSKTGDEAGNAAAKAAVSQQKNDGVFLVFGHGNSYLVQYNTEEAGSLRAQSAEKFNDVIAQKSPEYKQALADGTPISLTINSCNVASQEYVESGTVLQNPSPIARDISKSLPANSTVTAPDGYIWFGNVDGKPGILGVQETSSTQQTNTGNGGFITFQNGQEVSKEVKPYFPTPAQLRQLKKH